MRGGFIWPCIVAFSLLCFVACTDASPAPTRTPSIVVSPATTPANAPTDTPLAPIVAADPVPDATVEQQPTSTLTPTIPPTTTKSVPTEPPSPAAQPDLVVEHIGIQLERGGDCNYTSTQLGTRIGIANVGDGNAGPFVLDVNGSQLEITSGLGPGQKASIWVPGYSRGENEIFADALQQIDETNEDNNGFSRSVPIPTLPAPCTPTPGPDVTPASTPVSTPTATPGPTPVPQGGGGCVSDPDPEFTAHITDLSKIDFIIPPAVLSGNRFKNRSYVWISRDETGWAYEVPIYAPVDSTLTGITFYSEPALNDQGQLVDVEQFSLSFQVSCEVS